MIEEISNPAGFVRNNRTETGSPHYAALTVETPHGIAQFACANSGGLVIFDPQEERVLGFIDSNGDGRWTAWRADGTRLGLVDASDSGALGDRRRCGDAAIAWLRSLA